MPSASKRSLNASVVKEKRKKTGQENEKFPDIYKGKSLFIKMVKESGLILMNGNSSNMIKCDQTVFLKQIEKSVKSHDDYPEVVDDIMEGIEKYLSDKKQFVRSMLTTEIVDCDDSDRQQRSVQDSVIRLMLKTQTLQSATAHLLIKHLEDYKDHSSLQMTSDFFGSQQETVNVPQLILNQLRWLDVLQDSQSIASKLLEMACKMSYQSACAIITSLPEIINDEIHDMVATKLKELLSSNVELTISILDTLCSLNCSDKTMLEVKQSIFSCLQAVKIDELPVVVKYLLQTITATNAETSAHCLRQHLNFCPSSLSQSSQSNKQESEKTSVRLTAEAILSAIQYQPCVADAFLKLFKGLKEDEFTSSDFVSLVLLCSNFNTGPKKLALSVMKSKLKSYSTIESMLQTTFEDCHHVLIPYFTTLSDLAGGLLSSNHPVLQHIGAVLYTCMFSKLDGFCRQEVIGCLVQHIGSSSPSEVDCALGIMRNLAVDYLSLLSPFTLFVKGILDHVDCLSCHQIRLIYEVLSRLAFTECEGRTPAIQDELHMLIRKQLTHTSQKYCYIGIIGSVKILSVLAIQNEEKDECYKMALSILKLLDDTTKDKNKIRAYYLDELATLFCHEIDPRLSASLNEIFHQELSEKFLEAPHMKGDEISTKPRFNISKESDDLNIPIYPAIQKMDFRHELLCPLLRAVLETDNADSSNLRQITFAPIILHTACSLKDFKMLGLTEKKMILDSLFVTLNWFREQINALTRREGESHRHALTRIKHYVTIENFLQVLVPALPKYSPPIAILDFNDSLVQSVRGDSAGTSSTQEDLDQHTSNLSGDGTQEESTGDKLEKQGSKSSKKKSEVNFNIRNLKPQYLREMDANIFNLLKNPMGEDLFELDVNAVSDSETLQLLPDHLLFLLQDLLAKVQHKLVSLDRPKKISPFSSTTTHFGFEKLHTLDEIEFGSEMCDLIPNLCNHLESVCTPFQSNASEDLELEQRQVLISCYEHLIQVLLTILSWNGAKRQSRMRKHVLLSIARRISPDLNENSSLNQLLQSSFSYMKNFESNVTKISLSAATNLSKLLSVLAGFQDDFMSSVAPDIREFTLSMMRTNWPSESGQSSITGGKRNEMLGNLLRLSLQYADDVLQKVSHFVDESLCKLGSNKDEECVYPCFQKSNAHVLFVCLIETLAEESNRIPGIKSDDDESARIALLLRWSDCMKIVGVLIRLLREFHTMNNIVASLKCGRILIDNFIKNGMPVCEKMFNLYQDDVVSLLKDLQISTRQLQHMTCHSKVSKNISLSKHVPPLKRCLETLLFRVKGMLALHSCQEAFWLGNLKNRNIRGEEILSQVVQANDDSEEEDESIVTHDVDMSYSESY